MKKTIKSIKRFFVTRNANRKFRKAVQVANSWYNATHKRYYVIGNPMKEEELVSIDTSAFFSLRKEFGLKGKTFPLELIKMQAWYYTPNHEGRDRIDPKEFTKRRLAFIRWRLEENGLLEEAPESK